MAVRSRKTERKSTSETAPDEKLSEFPPQRQQKDVQTKRFRCAKFVLVLIATFLLSAYLVVPCVLRFSQRLQNAFVYLNFINAPWFVNLSSPSELGLQNARHFFLKHEESGCKIGVWQILPASYRRVTYDNKEQASFLSDGRPIVLYMHGNVGNRARASRIGVYEFLTRDIGVHVVTFDYRGFGDSDCYPSEENTKEDGLLVWNWIHLYAPEARVYLWGHSLGSAVASNLAENLTRADTPPSGLLLDAPFTSIAEAGSSHPSSFVYWLAPISSLFRQLVLDHFYEKHSSIDRLPHITCPLLIVHGDNDFVIPIRQGQEMYEAALASRKADSGEVEFLDCEGISHNYNYRCPLLMESAKKFFR